MDYKMNHTSENQSIRELINEWTSGIRGYSPTVSVKDSRFIDDKIVECTLEFDFSNKEATERYPSTATSINDNTNK